MGKRKKPRDAVAAASNKQWQLSLGFAAAVAVVLAAAFAWFWQDAGAVQFLSVMPNGGNESVPRVLLSFHSWRDELHEQYPEAQHIALWDVEGNMVAWSNVNGSSLAPGESGGRFSDELSAVTDDHPFMWSPSREDRYVDVGPSSYGSPSRRFVKLQTISDEPRVFMAHNVLTVEECDALRIAGSPHLEGSISYVQGEAVAREENQERRRQQPRTSSTAWLRPEKMSALDASTLRLVRSAQDRLRALSRLDLRYAENMQVLKYEAGDHYHYHLDNGGAAHIKGRALTALVYLNDDFEGGETNWPLGGIGAKPDLSGVNTRHVYQLRQHFNGCQTAVGTTLRPKRGAVALFYTLRPNSHEQDWTAWHGSCDVTKGVKWAANFWWNLNLMKEKSPHAPRSAGAGPSE
uniref:Fe2OG dioxygenase domain-containing protein n=1 Tax=Haptolina brevifila TaxID=156173 RepID=A0A7S2BWW0_9EUKA|mmetsp:Transcript_17677/g.35616  ORF Transcript_17677/g.35616 Transcript_17677/m.35616 type:complete len:405 (+) Transcript_17677:87-1301(+)|eukprot:CAMPEP_0174694320 /NCGR_PEP_ID=MMETSP1094-20130205/947_1 /TAXON_ID=156173 /ORGANISM="Chrysochromulina brevifilum, Strain UTEX LB 985" /LENGTH=404 /DNA_ID=CAMNT_0015890539 /DNA_START=76 /DNA_END=1290 /DNA_ORIENTATION=-